MNGQLRVDVLEDGRYRAVAAWPREVGPRKLLLVDDHPDIAELIKRYLAGSGMAGKWDLAWAGSAEEARQYLADNLPALIILDVILPHEDGWEFLIALKADALTREIPVVVCSGIVEPDLVRSLGAQGSLPKPFSAAQLVQALTAWVG
jgi:CheY-like chemotaxis protein